MIDIFHYGIFREKSREAFIQCKIVFLVCGEFSSAVIAFLDEFVGYTVAFTKLKIVYIKKICSFTLQDTGPKCMEVFP